MSEDSLRLKKKNATRQALAEAAFELAMERGIDDLVVEDIVNEAGYSRRTFANHFSCKEEAIASALTMSDFHRHSSFSLEGLTPLGTIELYIKRSFTIDKLKRLHELITLSRNHPTLSLFVIGVLKEIQDFARQGISEEFGSEYPNEYYHLLIGAVFGALMPVLDGSIDVELPVGGLQDQNGSEFDEYMKTVFSTLREGFK
ncbi:TetR/AcrR family transcriptional regulator [Aquibacillus salsiterrae]|uniref:TetR/AcrR family transcriptional regulator n=1 Tax=Aquibacillus salsiterrae TaxID=2950439 RepID=A0A9X4AHH5_9BACI|nr:TetR/AcrR family transcriptional regulator [Aquibacillus salsiterrae]MDC3418330.1 TetR/AcrR family transcriptional regulator [Aquibacillus salsiterrae]